MSAYSSDHFYAGLPQQRGFERILDTSLYTPFPDDWIVVVTDVVNSTVAIGKGLYKEVNIAGAITTMAFANALTNMEFPFVFGGDGTTYVLPGSVESEVRPILADVQRTVRDSLQLELRAGIVPMRTLYDMGYDFSVVKIRVSDRYAQAVFSGGGVEQSEKIVKAPDCPRRYSISPRDYMDRQAADFNGFSCRWQDVPSAKGVTLALIIKAVDETAANHALGRFFSILRSVFSDDNAYNPITRHEQHRTRLRNIRHEALFTARTLRGWRYQLQRLKIWLQIQLVHISIHYKLHLHAVHKDLSAMREHNIQNSDYRKYDGSLKMILSCTPNEHEKLVHGLDVLEEEGSMLYGIHVSDRAVMTCLVHPDTPQEVHFIDAADGGYALAAARLKAKIKANT